MTDDKVFGDYCYDVWRRGGNPDAVNRDDVPAGFDWIYDSPSPEHLPTRREHERIDPRDNGDDDDRTP